MRVARPEEQRASVLPARHRRVSVAANARLTSSVGALLLVLLALEGVTIVGLGRLTTAHVVIGMMLIPPVVVKMASTGYRLVRYYAGDPAYRKKGPPPVLLRLLGPFVVVLTAIVIASGVALLFAPYRWRAEMMFVHKASFVLWFGAMTIHVIGHIVETARLAPRDWSARTRRDIAGAGARQWLVVVSLAAGLVLGIAVAPQVGTWLAAGRAVH
ncbi:MAG: hypothetical protein ACLQK4_14065 [Acidimicrobiales bacterium]|jgi:hypothetical protein